MLSHYRSELVERIRASPVRGRPVDGQTRQEIRVLLQRSAPLTSPTPPQGFFPNRPIYILGEIIHNPEVLKTTRFAAMGIKFLSGNLRKGRGCRRPQKDDVVIIPGPSGHTSHRPNYRPKGCQFVDTTCGDVAMKASERVRQYSKDRVTSIIHGKAWHEETKATSSQTTTSGGGHYLSGVHPFRETKDYSAARYILEDGSKAGFISRNSKAPILKDLIRTSICKPLAWPIKPPCFAVKPKRSAAREKNAMSEKYGAGEIERHFRFFDTICGATQDRQDALEKLLRDPLNLLSLGGYNSSNTSPRRNGRSQIAHLLHQERGQNGLRTN